MRRRLLARALDRRLYFQTPLKKEKAMEHL